MSTKSIIIHKYHEHPEKCPECNYSFRQSEEPVKSGYHYGDGQWMICCNNCGFIRYDVRNAGDSIKYLQKNCQ